MTFSAIVTSHANERGLRRMLGNLIYQSRPPDEILVLASNMEVAAFERLREDFHRVLFYLEQNREDWGHAKRALGLELAAADFVGWFNDDDSYDARYLERMLDRAEAGFDIVYCDWTGVPGCDFRAGSSTSGNFIVRTSLARAAGYTDRHYEADGAFIDRLREATPLIARVDELLYFHNRQETP